MSECSIPVDPDETCSVHRSRIRKAKKDYRCCECHGPISAGTEYLSETALLSDGWSTYRTCLDCASIRKALFKEAWEWGGMFEYLRSHLDSSGGVIPSHCFADMTPEARETVMDLARRYREEE